MNKEEMRDARLDVIKAFVFRNIGRSLINTELHDLVRLSDQTLHLLAAAIDQQEGQHET